MKIGDKVECLMGLNLGITGVVTELKTVDDNEFALVKVDDNVYEIPVECLMVMNDKFPINLSDLTVVLKFLREPDSDDIPKRYLREILRDIFTKNLNGFTETNYDSMETEFFDPVKRELEDMGLTVEFTENGETVNYQVKWE